MRSRQMKGFTLVEVLVVVSIISLLSAVTVTTMQQVRQQTRLSTAKQELRSFHQAMQLYMRDREKWPDDVNRDIPAGLGPYLSSGDWPQGPWPGSVYDWDNWSASELEPHDPHDQRVLQISIRFCPLGDTDESDCRFPDAEWAENFDYHSSVYYCVQGPCRSHSSTGVDHPGLCVNC